MRRFVSVVGLSLPVVLAASAAVLASGHRSGFEQRSGQREGVAEADDAGTGGGPIERFHPAGACNLVSVSGLPGNWTHGDYVTAVAGSGDAAMISTAAQSDCGKPMVAVGHGGPPEHALANRAAHVPDEATEHGPPLSVPPSGS